MQGARVRSLVGELKSRMQCGKAKKKKKEEESEICLNNPAVHVLSDPQKLYQAVVAWKPISLFGDPFVSLKKGKQQPSTKPIIRVKHSG